jgi:MFS family permease
MATSRRTEVGVRAPDTKLARGVTEPAREPAAGLVDRPCIDCLDEPSAAKQTRRAVPRRVAFWLAALILSVTMLGTTLPTPLYVIYQAQWHFSAAIVTVTFAVYAAAVLATLLLAGRSSDQAGRKPVLAVALACSALSTVVFILAPNVYAPHPTVLVFEVYLAVLAAAGLCLFLVPETVTPRRRPALRFAGLGIPERGRSEFIAAATAAFAAFALIGLFAALAPTFLGNVLNENSHAVQGGVVFLLLAVGAVTEVLLSRFNSRRVVLAGLGLFLAGLALIVAALSQADMALFLAGTVVAGAAVGAVFLGSMATANRLAPPRERGRALSAFFVACYAGLIIPVVAVGVATEFISDFAAVLALSVVLAALSLFSFTRIRNAR